MSNFGKSIENVTSLKKKNLLILTEDSIFHLWSLNSKTTIKSIELTLLPMRLKSMKVKNVCKGNKDNVFFNTWEGDMVKLSLKSQK